MAEKKVYVLLTDTGTLFTKTIKLYTRNQYNHASIAFDENLKEVYSFGRKRPRNPFIGGFVRENITEGLLRNATCAVYCVTISETEYHSTQQYIKEIDAEKENYRYNFIGLFAVILNKQLKRENAFFCSQFVASVLKESGGIDFSIPLSLVTPHDLQIVENSELIYQGMLKDYKQDITRQQNISRLKSPFEVLV